MFTYEFLVSALQFSILILSITLVVASYFLKKKSPKSYWILFVVLPGILSGVFTYLIFEFNNELEEIKLRGSVTSRSIHSNRKKLNEVEKKKINSEHPDDYIVIQYGSNSAYFHRNELEGKYIEFAIVGDLAPIRIGLKNDVIFISTLVYSLDGTIAGEIIDNKWKVNKDNSLICCSDDYGVQIIDGNNIPCLIVDYLNKQTIQIKGVFFFKLNEIESDASYIVYHTHIYSDAGLVAIPSENPIHIEDLRKQTKHILPIFNSHCERVR